MSEEVIHNLISIVVCFALGAGMTWVWNGLLKLQELKIKDLEERVEFCEKWVKDLSAQYGEFLEGVKQAFKEAQEQCAKERAAKEKQDQVCECNLDNKEEET